MIPQLSSRRPHMDAAYMGVAISDFCGAVNSGNKRELCRQRRRLRRMLDKYSIHSDVARYAEYLLRNF